MELQIVGLFAVLAYLATHVPTVATPWWQALPWVVVAGLAAFRLYQVWG